MRFTQTPLLIKSDNSLYGCFPTKVRKRDIGISINYYKNLQIMIFYTSNLVPSFMPSILGDEFQRNRLAFHLKNHIPPKD